MDRPQPSARIVDELGPLTENAPRMDYPAFIAIELPIGSGAIEYL